MTWTGTGTSKSGKPHNLIQIQLAGRPYGEGKTYNTRIVAIDYQMREQFARGAWVAVAGDGEPKVEQGQSGKSYAVLHITGRVTRLDVPVSEAAVQEADDAGEPQG